MKKSIIISLFLIILFSFFASALIDSSARQWTSIAMNDDGSKLGITALNDYIYTSDDYGISINQQLNSSNKSWYSIGISNNGLKRVATDTGLNSHVYISSDGGDTWNQTSLANSSYVTSSIDGSKIAVITSEPAIWVSNDSGTTFSLRISGTNFNTITSSSNGSKLASGINGGFIYTSNDSGITWALRGGSGSHNWYSIASSGNGNILIGGTHISGSGLLYVSNDSGHTWVGRNGAYVKTWQAVAMSDDGQYMYAGDVAGYIHASNDTGITWHVLNNSGIHQWWDIKTSSNGSMVGAVDHNYGHVYISYDYGETWNQSFNPSNITQYPICIDNHQLCFNPLLIGEEIYCEIMNITYCAVSCNNTETENGTIGICDNGICSNDCSILGYQECDSTTSFKICGNYDTDACLEYQSGFGCLGGQICSNGYCVTNNATGISSNHAFTVTPYSISSDEIVYSNNPLTKILTVNTFNYIHIQGFSINTNYDTTYSSRTCKYSESNIYADATLQNINASLEKILSPLTMTGYINISVLPKDNINATITLYDSLDNPIQSILLTRNSSAKEACIYKNASSTPILIYCDYSVNSYDDLSSIDLQIFYEFQSSTYTIKGLFNRLQDYAVYTHPELFYSADVSRITINSSDADYKEIKINIVTQPQGFSTTLRGDYDFLTCTYSQVGCYLVRTYNNMIGGTDFTNYYDYTICMQSFTNPDPSATAGAGIGDFLSGEGLTAGLKYLIIIVVIMTTFIAGYFVGLSVQEGKAGFIFGIVLSVFELIAFTIFGWIPVWITIMLGIITIALSILIIVKTGDSGSGV